MTERRRIVPGDRLNLERLNFLVVDDNIQSLDIIGQALVGYGVRNIFKCQTAKDAREVIERTTVDCMIADAQMPDEDGYSLVRWVRGEASEPNRFMPIIICTGHTRMSQIMHARDCGAHFMVAKPITPKVLLERIFWVAKDDRAFVQPDTDVGPDRRCQRLGPPNGIDGRRKDDPKGALGAAVEPNLSQDEIDSFMKPAKVAL
jgi:CheY-like chemotaxis protein